MEQGPNYGRSYEAGDDPGDPGPPAPPPRGTMSPQDERTWSTLSHLSVLVWPITGFLPVAPLIVWLAYKDRSPRVGFHALETLWYQVAWLVIFTVGGFLATLFSILTFGFGLILVVPLAFVLGVLPFAHSLYAAYKVYNGVDFRYPIIADKIERRNRRMI